jgi:hypothetical protein
MPSRYCASPASNDFTSARFSGWLISSKKMIDASMSKARARCLCAIALAMLSGSGWPLMTISSRLPRAPSNASIMRSTRVPPSVA